MDKNYHSIHLFMKNDLFSIRPKLWGFKMKFIRENDLQTFHRTHWIDFVNHDNVDVGQLKPGQGSLNRFDDKFSGKSSGLGSSTSKQDNLLLLCPKSREIQRQSANLKCIQNNMMATSLDLYLWVYIATDSNELSRTYVSSTHNPFCH